ncbi:MAG TPA: endopeptidase [Ramlibacter sp.]|nr:endopeptidase [Ramlibacter sp.]
MPEPEHAARAEKAVKAQLERQTEIDDLSWLMSDKRGRRFMWRLLQRTGIYQLSFVPGDSNVTAFREGNRNQGLQLLSEVMQHCPSRFSEMQKEAPKHERRNESKDQ